MKNIFTVDVEDWFHILEVDSTPDLTRWGEMESRVEKNFIRMLELFDNYEIKATCFFLGWIAGKFPHLVKEAVKRGHEAASHGYAHRLVYTQTKEEFSADLMKAKDIIEQISGEEVISYRSPGFSITEETPWAVEEIVKAGYKIDSSVFPAEHGHGGMSGANMAPYIIKTPAGDLQEFPISVEQVINKRICFFGGGYLRLFPYFLIRYMSDKVNRNGCPVIYYIHPREIDPEHPRLEMSRLRTFKSYVNLKTTERKMEKILSRGEFVTLRSMFK